ncbi:LPD38 domain-containing protein, partial [Undibacterium sp.]|uniref:PBECR3 domain-containing polyvalent protein n=1 Tax=Undibacterium sp. TaxID=1914977 RepID=UPI003750A11A
MGSMTLADIRKKYPQTNGLSDEDVISVIAQRYGASIEDTKTVLNYEPPAMRSRTWGEVAGDTLVTAAKSAVGLPQSIAGLIDIPTGGRVGKALEEAGYRPNEAQDMLSGMYSEPQKAANQRVADAQGFTDTAIAYAQNPSTIATTIGESAGQMLGGAGAARKLVSLFPKLAPWAAGALGEGLMGAGSAESQLRAESEDGLTTAKQGLSALASGAGTAAFGALGGKIANSKLGQKVGIADIDTMLAGGGTAPKTTVGFLKSALASGFSESALEEMPQSAWEQMMQNYAQDKPILDGVSKAMASGAVAGFAMGGAGGGYNAMVSKAEPEKVVPPKNIMDQTDIDSVINAAENSIEQAPMQQRESMPIDDPMRLEIINNLPEALRDAATRAYNIIIDDEAPKGIKKQNQKLLDDILAQAASEMQPIDTAPIEPPTIEQPKPLEPFEQIKQLQSKVSDLESNNPFEQDHMDSLNELQSAVTNYTASKLESGEMPVFTSGELTIIVTPSAKQEGLFQVTRYSKNGAIGDSEYTSIEKAVESEGLQYNTPLSGKEAVAAITQANEAEGNFQSRLAEQKQKESNRVLADIESTDSRVSFEQEKSRVNQRNAIIDSILASDAAVDMRPAQIADMVKSSMAEQGYANPVLSDSEFSRIKRFNDIAKAEPVEEVQDQTNLEGQAPSSNLSDLVPERRIDASKSNVIATKLPADLISVAQESETNKDFWKALTARKIPLGPERNALMAAYKELKAQPVNPTVTPATAVAPTTEIAKTVTPEQKQEVTPQSKQFSDSLKGIIESEVTSMAQVIETKKLPETSPAFGNYVAKQTHVETAAVVAQSVVESGDLSLFEAKAPESNRTFASLYPSTYAKLQEHVESAQPTTAIPNSASNIAPTAIPNGSSSVAPTEIPSTVTSVTPTEIPNSQSSISTTAIPKTEIASSTTSITPTAIPTSATSIAPTEIPTSAATVAPTAIPETTLKPDGNLSIKGNTKELQTQLKEAGIPSLPSKDGVTVGAKNVEKAQEFIASIVPVETKVPEVKTENNLSKTENNLVSVDSATIGPASKDYQSAIVAPANEAIDSGKAIKVELKDGSSVDLVNMTDKDGARTIVAVSDGNVVGSLGYATIEGFSPDAYVDKDFQRKGIASAMYDLAEKTGGVIPPVDATNAVRTEDGAAFRNARAGVLPSAESGVKLSNPAQQTSNRSKLLSELPSKTSKELHVIARTAKQKYMQTAAAEILQERRAATSEKKSIAAKKLYERANKIDSSRDTMAQVIAKLGGIGIASAKQRFRLTPEELKIQGSGLRRAFTTGGKTVDDMAAELAQLGYINVDENGKYDKDDFESKLFASITGDEVLTPDGIMQKAEADQARRQEFDVIESYADQSTDELDDIISRAFDAQPDNRTYTDEQIDAFFGIKTESSGAPKVNSSEAQGESDTGNQAASFGSAQESDNESTARESQDFRLTGETAQEARNRIAQEEREAQARTEDEARLAAAERDSTAQREIGNRQDVLADSFSLTAQVNDQAQQKKNDDQTFKDQLAGQADIFSSNPNEAAKEQIQASDLTPAEKLANIAAVNRGDVSPDDVAQALGNDRTLYSKQSAKNAGSDNAVSKKISELLEMRKSGENFTGVVKLMPVSNDAVQEALSNGLDISGYSHAIDGSSVAHVLNKHGNEKKENARGQIAIADKDFLIIPQIVNNPDYVVYGLKNNIGRDVIAYLRKDKDGSLLYLEEVRTGKKTLNLQSMRRYPSTTDATSLLKSLRQTSKTLTENEISIVESPAARNTNAQEDAKDNSGNQYNKTNEANTDNGLGDVKIVPAVIVEKNVKSILAEEGAVQVNVSGGNVDVLKQIAERFGKKIVFFREVETNRSQNKGVGLSTGSTQSKSGSNEGSDSAQGENGSYEVTNGFVTPRQPKLVFLNVDGANHLTYILGHELGHSLKIDDPKLWAEMTVQLQPLVRKFGKYRAEYGQGLTNDVDVLEELVSDVIGDNFLNNAFWQDMAKQSQSLFKRIADKAIALLNKSIRLMGGRDVSIFISDMEKARSIIAETMLKYVDGVSKGRYEAMANNNGDTKRSTDRKEIITGDNKRERTAEQLRAFKNVGRTIEVPTLKERWESLTSNLGKKMAQGIVDQFAPVKELNEKAYMLMRLSKGASGAFETMLNGGQLKLSDGVYDFDEKKKGGVVERLLTPLQGEADDFMWWVAGNRAERLAGQGKERLFSTDDIAAFKSLANGDTAFDYVIQHGLRKGKTTRNRKEIYRDSLATFNEFNKNALDMAEQSGLIDGESRNLWEDQFYIPFYRVSENSEDGVRGVNIKSGVVRQQAFKQLKGGKDKLNSDLLQNTLMNWAHLLDASAKNRAAKATLEAAVDIGIAIEAPERAVSEISTSIGNKNGVVWAMDGGVKRFFIVDDPYVLAALNGLEYAGMRGPLMDAMSTMKHVLTMTVTASPFFKVKNLIRDSVSAIAISGLNYNVASNVVKGYKLTNPKSEAYFKLLAGGGTIHFGAMLEGSESKRIRKLVNSGVDESTILRDENAIKEFYRKVPEPIWNWYNEIGNRGEAINRASLYDQMIRQGKTHAEASLMARDLMDFSMQGGWTSVRFLTQVVPFMNARLQGLYKLGRGANEDPRKFGIVLGAVALASISLMLAYSDDDDWKKREDWDRDTFWWFKVGGIAYRIPKPFEIGAIGTLAERGVEYFATDEMTGKRFKDRLLHMLGDNLSMNPIPQIFKPIMDIYANKDSFTG